MLERDISSGAFERNRLSPVYGTVLTDTSCRVWTGVRTGVMMEHNLPLTFETLRVHYGTCRAFLIRTEGRHKVYSYRKGVMTDLGDLDLKEWMQLAKELIRTSREEKLYQNLLEWGQAHNDCRQSGVELETDALKRHMYRIFIIPFGSITSRSTANTGQKSWIHPGWSG